MIPSQPTDVLIGAFSPDLGARPAERYLVSVDVNVSAVGGADYYITPQASSQGVLAAQVIFGYEGHIHILDYLGGGLTYVDTGVAWQPGVYQNLLIDLDPVAGRIEYSLNHSVIYSSSDLLGADAVEQVVFYCDNWNNGEVGDFDNVFIATAAASGSATIVRSHSVLEHGDGSFQALELSSSVSLVEPRASGLGVLQLELSGPVTAVQAQATCTNAGAFAGSLEVEIDDEDDTVAWLYFDPPLPDADCCTVELSGDASGSVTVRTLAGDVNRDGQVTTADASLVKPHFQETVNDTNFLFDFNGDGLITTSDYALIKPLFQHTAPACD